MDDADERTVVDDVTDAEGQEATDETVETAAEISYDEQRNPARPRRLRLCDPIP